MTTEEKIEMLSLLDQNKQLIIYDYLEFYQTDVLVKCFVDMVLEHKVIPVLPSQTIIESWLLHEVNVNVSNDLMRKLVNNFIKYFQTKYFNNNLKNAKEENKLLFNPKNNFWIPGFAEFPEKDIVDLNEAKFKYVQQVQDSSSKGTSFVLQNRILRNIDWTMQFIKNGLHITDNVEQKKHLEYILAMAYKTAIMEFPSSYGPKVIDWSTYESKATTTIPKWRKENASPPIDIPSVYSKSVLQKIDNGSINFDGKTIAAKSAEFMEATVEQKQKRTLTQNFRGHHRGSFHNSGYRGGGRGRARQHETESQEQGRYFGGTRFRGNRRSQSGSGSQQSRFLNRNRHARGSPSNEGDVMKNKEVVETFI